MRISHLAAATVAATTILLTACSTPEDTSPPNPAAPTGDTASEDASEAVAQELTDVRAVTLTQVSVGDDRKTLTAMWWGKSEGCEVVDRVEADVTDALVTVTVYTGTPEGADSCVTTEAVTRITTVQLDDPLGDGQGLRMGGPKPDRAEPAAPAEEDATTPAGESDED